MSKFVTFGETMVLFEAATQGRLRYVPSFLKKIGGAESNVAIALTKLGHSATWFGKVSDDEMGHYVVREVKAEGVDTECVTYTTDAPTALYIKEHRREEELAVYYYRHDSAGSTLTKEDLAYEKIADASILHVTGITPLLSDSCYEAVLAGIQCAKEHGTFVSFDPNLRFALIHKLGEEVARQRLVTIAAQADLILPGLDEAKWLFGDMEEQDYLTKGIELGARKVVIKNGGDYSLFKDEQGTGKVNSFRVKQVVDPVGAGDGFAAGVLAGLLENKSLEESVRMGAAVGALVIGVKGDIEGLPTRKEVDAFLCDDNKVYGGVSR
ncbi:MULTISPECIES: sugar kinase [Bacillaceae]|uniref:Carbohydrate kinase PfkB domain-containing protein n=1 Tax=Alkalicoccobacillus plakortidis TaxID=444060 RepID=A0A9D5DLP2_9BACI|nr:MULTISPECIES: sugar kinase [Bacillaceae]KQL56198.1 hypothetical protein AN965_14845 [Alkalicoccobacillus plakortidis]RQW22523.1 sugar kinase [Bacillus sp. C1-1]